MGLDKFLHEVHYHLNNEVLLAIIPSLDKAYYTSNTFFRELPRKIISTKKPIFSGFPVKKRHKRVLFLTNACNLSCSYCFEGNSSSNYSMTPKMVEEIIEELFKEAENNKAKLISFSLFGGEPTIRWECVVKAVEVSNEMTAKTGIQCIKAIVTNGAMEDYKVRYLSLNFDNIYFSLDGPKELFLQQRKPKAGNEIFDVIFRNALIVYNGGANIGFKSTFTKLTIDKMSEIDDFFTTNFPFADRLFQPVMVEKTSELYISIDEFIKKFAKVKKNSCFPRNLYMPLFKESPSDRFCNLAIRNVIYPDNTVVACHRSDMCDPDDLVRAMFTVGKSEKGVIERFEENVNYVKKFNVNSIEKCENCFVRYHCCGGCPTIKLFENKDPLKSAASYCETIKEYYLELIASKLGMDEDVRYMFHELQATQEQMSDNDFEAIFKEVL